MLLPNGMLTGEKKKRRKEVIARKRLERAADRDGDKVDMRKMAQSMIEFAQPLGGEEEEEEGREQGHRDGGTAGAHAYEGTSGVPLHELSIDEQVRLIEGGGAGGEAEASDGATLALPLLSGAHLQAAKRIAGYLRLTWVQKGGGKSKACTLTLSRIPPRAGSGSCDFDAVSAYLETLDEQANGALTKRLPALSHRGPGPRGQQQGLEVDSEEEDGVPQT